MEEKNRYLHRIRRALFGFALALMAVVPVRSVFAQNIWANVDTRAHPIGQARFREYLPDQESLDIVVTLKLRNHDQLNRHVQALTNPKDPQFRHWLSRKRILADYAPQPNQANTVAHYLTKAGFTNVHIEANRLLITATGTAAVIRKAFNTELARFVRDGRESIANTKDVQVPAALSDTVLSVLGLQTLDRMRPLSIRADHVLASGSVQGINPINFPIAYDASSLPSASTQTVGIVTEGNMTQPIADLHQFESQNGLATINPTVVLAGSAGSDTSGTAEWDIDSQDIQAMAGGQVGTMIFYTAHSLSDANITQAINAAVTANTATVINISLGECETSAKTDGSMASDDQLFQLGVAQGQTFSVASGDTGSSECGNPPGTAVGAAYPASSPYVMAVGGTTLSTNANYTYAGETAWSDGGGSPSLYEAQPSWQNGIVPGQTRGVPDIAFDANPNSGAIVIVNGETQQWGGTSLASPLFVGSWLRIQAANNARLGFPATWIYSHGAEGTPAFHDITSGSNGAYTAAVGWDYCTGFSSFDVAATTLLTRSSVTVSVSPAAIPAGNSVTLTATVTGNSPTGTVQFQVNGVNFGSPVSLTNGVATLTTTQLPAGTDAITALYSGDANDAGSSSVTPIDESVALPSPDWVDGPELPPWGLILLASALMLVGVRVRRTHS